LTYHDTLRIIVEVKTTAHFEQIIRQRQQINREWCERIARNPSRTAKTPRGRIICWGWVEELNHYLRVILLEDGETLHTAMIDSGFKGGTR
jgi:hypothetical protein